MAATPFAGQGSSARSGATLTLDLDALFAELQARPTDDGRPVFTSTELSERLGKSLASVRKLIIAAQRAGKCKPTEKVVVGMDARPRRVQAYEFEV